MDRFDAALGLALIVSLVLTGQLVNLIGPEGPRLLRWAVWVLGYGGAVVVAWYVWVRPIEFSAPDSATEDVWEDGSASDASEADR